MKRVHSCIKLNVSYLVLYCILSCQQLSVHFRTRECKLLFVPSHLSRGFSCVKSFSWSFSVDLAENWQQERCSFPRTYRHKVSASSFMQCFQSLFIIFLLYFYFRANDSCPCGLPVCAQAIRSRFDLTMGMAYFCTGVGLV